MNGLGSAIIKGTILSRALRLLYKIAFTKTRKALFQNSDDLNYFVSNNIVKKSNTGIVPGSGVDTSKYNMPAIKQNQILKFNLIGRMLVDKGIFEYIGAIRILKLKHQVKAKYYLSGFIDPDNPTGISMTKIEDILFNPDKLDEIKGIGPKSLEKIKKQVSAYKPPAREEAPVKEELIKKDPVKKKTIKKETSKEKITKEKPVKEDPVQEEEPSNEEAK